MLFFRRLLRERRAKRRAKKGQGKTHHHHHHHAVNPRQQQQQAIIFRSRQPENDHEILVDDFTLYPINTRSTVEDDSSSSNPSPTMTTRGSKLLDLDPASNTLWGSGHTKAMVRNYEEILDLHQQLEELKLMHFIDLETKDSVILSTCIELGFAKEDIKEALKELEVVRNRLLDKEKEVETTNELLSKKDEELDDTISDLAETKDTLAAISAELEQSRKTIEDKDATIADLEKCMSHSKTGAKVVLGLLTLGALCSDDH